MKCIYLVSGRGFRNDNIGRKISELHSLLSFKYGAKLVTGGTYSMTSRRFRDIGTIYEKGDTSRRFSFKVFAVNSISELRDVFHDFVLFFVLIFQRPGLIIERSSRLHIAGVLFSSLSGGVYVLEWKDGLTDYPSSAFKSLSRQYEVLKLKYAKLIIVESNVLRDVLSHKHSEYAKKIVTAYNGVNAEHFGLLKLKSPSHGPIKFGYVGSFAKYHGMHMIVDLAEACKRDGYAVQFHLYGDGISREALAKNCEEKGLLESFVFFHGRISESVVPQLLTSFDIGFLLDSTEIITPIKVMEYVASGLPIMVPNYRCNQELFEAQDFAFLFRPRDIESMLFSIRRFMSLDLKMRARIRENALRFGKVKLYWDNVWNDAFFRIDAEISK